MRAWACRLRFFHTRSAWNFQQEPVSFKNCNNIQQGKVKATRANLLAALKECSSSKDLHRGNEIHSAAIKCGEDSNVYVASSLVDMYAKCRSMVDARRIFDTMQDRDVVCWNALMFGYAENGDGDMALDLFQRMDCKPNSRSFVAALKSCSILAGKEEAKNVDGKLLKVRSLKKGRAIHSQAKTNGCDSVVYVANTLVDMYTKCGSMSRARKVFDRMQNHTVVSWNALMLGYVENGEAELALDLFQCMRPEPNSRTFVAALKACTILAMKEEGMQVDGKLVKVATLETARAIHSQAKASGCDSDMYVANTMVDMYAKCRSMVEAKRVFDGMRYRTVISWTALMMGYVEAGEGETALGLFSRMEREGFVPDAQTCVAALKACSTLAALEAGTAIHADVDRLGYERNVVVANALVDFYSKCGSMVNAHKVFDSIVTKDLVSWTSLIAGYSRQGNSKEVFLLFDRMRDEGFEPDGITFVCILNVCSHAGLVDKGKEYFEAISSKYRIAPEIEHYHCMVDMLGRANHMDDAVTMIKTMPFKPNAITWTTILGACRKWKNVSVAKRAFKSIMRLNENDGTPYAYVLMANIYGSMGMWELQSKVEAMRMNARAWKQPGQSRWTDHAGMVYKFVAGDTSHPEVLVKLEHLMARVKDVGYVADIESVGRNISDEEKHDSLCGHSERLAIACALGKTAPGAEIRIVKNLRVCDDCHRVTAIISSIEQRSIICRDASRFHIFKDGQCSCGDFW